MTSAPHRHDLEPQHDHDADHDHGWRAGLKSIFRPHSHDAADSMDSALEASERGIRAVKISFAALAVTAIAQAGVVVITGSVALLADTIHNFSDALTAIPLFVAFRIGRRPATRRYTYGYRRAEDLAGLFVVAMIALSAVIAGWQAIDRLINPRPLDHLGALVAAGIVGFAGNELVALYRMREGRAIGSAALVADGLHARTDGFTSLAVAAGGLGAWAGFDRADPIAGLVISIAIFAVLISAARQIYHRLMDAVDPDIVDRIEQVAAEAPGPPVGAVRVRWLGHRLTADLDLSFSPDATVDQVDAVTSIIRGRLVDRIPHLDDVGFHVVDARSPRPKAGPPHEQAPTV